MFILALILCIVIISILIHLTGNYNERYWKKRGVTFYKRNKVLGVFWDFITTDKALFQNLNDIYNAYPNDPAVGLGAFVTPSLYVRDPINIQKVLATDFNSFYHRGIETNENDLLANNILFLNGKKWKLIRQSMSPLFTSMKLKDMYYIIDKSATDFIHFLRNDKKLLKGDAFNTLTTFCSAAICGAVFGVTTKSIFDSPFHTIARSALKPTFIRNMQFVLNSISSTLFNFFDIKIFKDHEEFFIGTIKKVLRQRECENIKKHDFADMCISIQKNGNMKDNETGLEIKPTDELLAAQGFFFFLAGVEPTATEMFSTLVELGKNPIILQRLCSEIDEEFEKYQGNLSYDVINGMEYLDMVMSEAMRLHPPIGFLTRKCVQDTVLPTGNIKVDKGTKITTPIFEIQNDPKYYSDPEIFNPERFSKLNKSTMKDITYMPFGKGNRICIGMRYAQLQAKAGLVHLLRNFSIKTHVSKDGIKYSKEQFQVRMTNVDVEFIPRM